MHLRFPLFAKILLWFFLNLALLGVVLYGFFRFQFHVGLDSLLSGQTGSRMEAVSSLIETELKESPRTSWDAVLERFSGAYEGVDFFVFRPNGIRVAGTPVDLPIEVRTRLAGFRAAAAPLPPVDTTVRLRRQRLNKWEPRAEPVHKPHPKFMVRTENPVRYWVGVRLHQGKRVGVMAEQEILLAMSGNLNGGGLFFDLGPWATVGFSALALSVLFWLPLVHGITRSISQMTRATERLAEGDFDIRVKDSRRD